MSLVADRYVQRKALAIANATDRLILVSSSKRFQLCSLKHILLERRREKIRSILPGKSGKWNRHVEIESIGTWVCKEKVRVFIWMRRRHLLSMKKEHACVIQVHGEYQRSYLPHWVNVESRLITEQFIHWNLVWRKFLSDIRVLLKTITFMYRSLESHALQRAGS